MKVQIYFNNGATIEFKELYAGGISELIELMATIHRSWYIEQTNTESGLKDFFKGLLAEEIKTSLKDELKAELLEDGDPQYLHDMSNAYMEYCNGSRSMDIDDLIRDSDKLELLDKMRDAFTEIKYIADNYE